jgi:hypothetical protein
MVITSSLILSSHHRPHFVTRLSLAMPPSYITRDGPASAVPLVSQLVADDLIREAADHRRLVDERDRRDRAGVAASCGSTRGEAAAGDVDAGVDGGDCVDAASVDAASGSLEVRAVADRGAAVLEVDGDAAGLRGREVALEERCRRL